ncbi:hypothetical protein EV401DRAFT_1323998 [Pisolithus croceorrhizus]|nr:hypothetical protein EV401DRAFT_1323998 [Pisolithus croceorrhizus]
MSSPYNYSAVDFQPTSYLNYTPYQPTTPFLPSATTFPVPTASPYLRSFTPVDDPPYYNDTASNYPYRSRAFSWNGGVPPSPFSQSSWPSYRPRTHSFGGIDSLWGDSPYSPWEYRGSAHHSLLHPFLNGDSTLTDLYFDLSSPTFSPMRALSTGQFMPISAGELTQAATTPPVTRMRIIHHSIPQWPIDVELRYNEYAAGITPPITVGDVLYMIHHSLRRQISHADWAMLGRWKQTEVARAYTRRYSSVPQMAQLEAGRGVRRVDYLRDRHIFRGLVKTYDMDGFHCWKMIS